PQIQASVPSTSRCGYGGPAITREGVLHSAQTIPPSSTTLSFVLVLPTSTTAMRPTPLMKARSRSPRAESIQGRSLRRHSGVWQDAHARTMRPSELRFVTHAWDPARAAELEGDEVGLLVYRSNLLGSDLRITNFGGGNTSAKITEPDTFDP